MSQPSHHAPLEKTAAAALLHPLLLALLLHDLADLLGGVEELGDAAVEAHGLALVELGLAEVVGDALCLAVLLEAVVAGGHGEHLGLDGFNLLLRRRLRATHS